MRLGFGKEVGIEQMFFWLTASELLFEYSRIISNIQYFIMEH